MRQTVKRTVLGFAAALGILAVFTWQVGAASILRAVTGIETGFLVGGVLLSLSSVLFFGSAWWLVLRDVINVSYWKGLYLFFAAQFANLVTPFGQFGGEPAIAYIVSEDVDVELPKCLGAVLVGDILNAVVSFAVFFVGLAGFALFFSLGPFLPLIVLTSLVLATLIGGVFYLVWKREDLVFTVVDRVGVKLLAVLDTLNIREKTSHREEKEHIRASTELFHATLRDRFEQPRVLWKAITFLLLNICASITGLYLLLVGMGVPPLGYTVLIFIFPAAWLANYLPLPGGLGGVEVALSLLLLMFAAVPVDAASATTFIYRLSTYWVVLLVGGVFASQLSLTMFQDR